ncbi:DJ-1/PfpI family protein [Klebsiella sp. BIGb0407]|uniref:DJ-1/PfpI family protein n=1 Tax=Klebsiella sp. BIGb0407 TaxID=2940603 RepID=UPI002168A7B4|nr:DJ-1/PfpI family protein [Klebsiella sp. BIGb0407]MCS3431741.1 putative intracellular protease/amidase [Klebsiella sp. BIGb0407]
MKAALLISDGFEDAEAIIVYDILKRMKIDTDIISCSGSPSLNGYFSLSVIAGKIFNDVIDAHYDAVIIPGGPASTLSMSQNKGVIDFLKRHDLSGAWICGLCSAPARVLGANGLLKNRKYTCSGELWRDCQDGHYTGESVVVDGNLITGKGLGVSFDFAFTVAEKMLGDSDSVSRQAEHIYYPLSSTY